MGTSPGLFSGLPGGSSRLCLKRELDEEHKLCPNHTFRLSENKPDKGEMTRAKIDGGFFHDEDAPFIVSDVPNWRFSRFLVEFKHGGNALDPFHQGPRTRDDADARTQVRGQLYAYADCLLNAQHRTHVFMLFVNGPEFRLLHWDKSGLMVSHAYSYVKTEDDTRRLLSLLADLSALEPQAAGLDPSAHRLSLGSCGWKCMDWVAEDRETDIDELCVTEVYNTSEIPADFTEAVGDCPHFTKGGAYSDPEADMVGEAKDVWSAPRRTFKYIRTLFKQSLTENAPRYALVIAGKFYLVCDPMARTHGPFGRGTRGWPALEWHTQRLVFVKDAWQPHYDGVEPEHVTLKKLNEVKVEGVATLIAAEAYAGQVTYLSSVAGVTSPGRNTPLSGGKSAVAVDRNTPHEFAPPSSQFDPQNPVDPTSGSGSGAAAGPADGAPVSQGLAGVRHLRHVRMVVAEICLPLRKFPRGLDLILIILDAINAHQQAFNSEHQLLHRDVSVGNILILPRFEDNGDGTSQIVWRGILADWEMAKSVLVTIATQPMRTGTWAFMSILCQMDKTRAIDVDDELESFLHVLIFMAVVYMASDWEPHVVDGFVPSYFYLGQQTKSGQTCSAVRDKCIRQGTVTTGPDQLKLYQVDHAGKEGPVHPLNDVLSKLLGLFRARLLVHEHNLRALAPSPPTPEADAGPKPAIPTSVLARLKNRRPHDVLLPSAPRAPSARDLETLKGEAELLKSHDVFISILETAADQHAWPERDRYSDVGVSLQQPAAEEDRQAQDGAQVLQGEPEVGTRRATRSTSGM
ncbi:uncharacterized protein BXZ73DRAFT_54292 [Epithele typhae]|uniref:uncharacterized protein n=1 Tax=Epithele typhae TaxID=378194 RepID=UPI002008B582|nr:uncharacterized protein BXZ73DRAFT_54292 [Epithele typhae]KAH9915460.1 hypothetical protein BXZ73DRAFT_54292 [Epithele typhae]